MALFHRTWFLQFGMIFSSSFCFGNFSVLHWKVNFVKNAGSKKLCWIHWSRYQDLKWMVQDSTWRSFSILVFMMFWRVVFSRNRNDYSSTKVFLTVTLFPETFCALFILGYYHWGVRIRSERVKPRRWEGGKRDHCAISVVRENVMSRRNFWISCSIWKMWDGEKQMLMLFCSMYCGTW